MLGDQKLYLLSETDRLGVPVQPLMKQEQQTQEAALFKLVKIKQFHIKCFLEHDGSEIKRQVGFRKGLDTYTDAETFIVRWGKFKPSNSVFK